MPFKETALNYLHKKALSDKLAAEASLQMLLDHPAGIGDHSTKDLHDNLNEALSNYADASDRLEALCTFISEKYPDWVDPDDK